VKNINMGYSNYFKLKIEGKIKKNIKVSECDKGKFNETLNKKICGFKSDANFCEVCGSELEKIETYIDASDILIEELINEYPEGDVSYLLDKKGNSYETGRTLYLR
jgi:RecJ-like exonuclease